MEEILKFLVNNSAIISLLQGMIYLASSFFGILFVLVALTKSKHALSIQERTMNETAAIKESSIEKPKNSLTELNKESINFTFASIILQFLAILSNPPKNFPPYNSIVDLFNGLDFFKGKNPQEIQLANDTIIAGASLVYIFIMTIIVLLSVILFRKKHNRTEHREI